jgi:hypothetical protein
MIGKGVMRVILGGLAVVCVFIITAGPIIKLCAGCLFVFLFLTFFESGRWRVCCLLVLDSVTSTPQWIRQPKPRDVAIVGPTQKPCTTPSTLVTCHGCLFSPPGPTLMVSRAMYNTMSGLQCRCTRWWQVSMPHNQHKEHRKAFTSVLVLLASSPAHLKQRVFVCAHDHLRAECA